MRQPAEQNLADCEKRLGHHNNDRCWESGHQQGFDNARNKYCMTQPCSSAHRCARTSCEPCAWRYSLHISRRILAAHPRQLYVVTIEAFLHDPTAFRSWRVRLRNVVDHRRRACRWWREVGLWLWLGADGRVRGIVSLGAVTEEEFIEVIERRWPTTLRPIDVEELRSEVYFAVRPGIIFDTGPHQGRYQAIRLAVEPQMTRLSVQGWSRRD